MSTKKCKKCNFEKPLTEFHVKNDTKDGLAYTCKPCKLETNYNSRKKIKDMQQLICCRCHLVLPGKYFVTYKICEMCYQGLTKREVDARAIRAKKPKKPKDHGLPKKRVIGLRTVAAFLKIDCHTCECCGVQIEEKQICVDHDHKTGNFRFVLCTDCNKGLGLLGDDPFRALLLMYKLCLIHTERFYPHNRNDGPALD